MTHLMSKKWYNRVCKSLAKVDTIVDGGDVTPDIIENLKSSKISVVLRRGYLTLKPDPFDHASFSSLFRKNNSDAEDWSSCDDIDILSDDSTFVETKLNISPELFEEIEFVKNGFGVYTFITKELVRKYSEGSVRLLIVTEKSFERGIVMFYSGEYNKGYLIKDCSIVNGFYHVNDITTGSLTKGAR